MAGSADILATAGVDLTDFEAGITRITNGLGNIEKAGDKVNKSLGSVWKAVKAIGVTQGMSQIVKSLSEGGYQASELTKTLATLDHAQFSGVYSQADQAAAAFRNVSGAVLGVIESVPGLNILSAPFTAAAKDAQAMSNIFVTINRQTEDQASITKKLLDLEKQLADERTKGTHGERLDELTGAIDKERNKLKEKYNALSDRQIKLGDTETEGAEKRLAIEQLQVDAREKIAQLSESVKNPLGGMSPQASAIVLAGTEVINQQLKLQERGITLSLAQDTAQLQLNKDTAERGVTVADQFKQEEAIRKSLDTQLSTARLLYGENSLMVTALKAQRHESELRTSKQEFGMVRELANAELATKAQDAQLAGNTKLAALAKNRAQYETQIATALREGKKGLAEQLQAQQALNALSIAASDYLKTPSQRRAERKEQRRQDRAIRAVNSRDRVAADADERGAYNRRSSRDYVSPATERARAEYVSRHGGPQVQPKNSGMETGTITASTLIIQTLKAK